MKTSVRINIIFLLSFIFSPVDDIRAMENGILEMSETEYLRYSDSLHNSLCPLAVLNVDEYVTQSDSYGISRNGAYIPEEYTYAKNASVNKYNSVGSIPIISGWLPSGAKTYTVPINVPSGIGTNMTPSISLDYNSQQGMGLAGIGWSLGGLSSIIRVGKNIYYDGMIDGVKMDDTDNFILDGMRLIKISSSVYQSEQGNIKAVAHQVSGDISYFDVFYPDGNKARFGFGDDAKAINFPIIKYSDQWGNEINYEYTRLSGNNLINRISYNNGSSVSFEYEPYLGDYKGLYYSGGHKMVMDRYLKKIECRLNETILGKYELTHGTIDKFGLLIAISYISGDNRFNELKFSYGDTTLDYWKESTTKISKYLTSESNSGLRYVRGKFDYGTGNDGFVCFDNKIPYWRERQTSYVENFTNKYKGDEKIIIYSGLDEASITPLDTLTTGKGFIDVMCADITGTQREDIIRINNYAENSKDYLFFYVFVQDSISGVKQRTARRFEFVPETPGTSGPAGSVLKFRPKHFRFGDFNGDGKMEILVVASNQPDYKSTNGTKCYVLDIDTYDIRYDGFGFEFMADILGVSQNSPLAAENNSDKLLIVDINGDGKHEICHINNTGTAFYSFNTSGSAWPIQKVASFSGIKKADLYNRTILTCDLNGDGLTDLIVSPVNNNSDNKWKVFYSQGDGTFDESSFLSMKNNSKEDDCGFFFQDVNSDGLPDLVGHDKTAFWVYENGPLNFIPNKSPTELKRIGYPANLNPPPVLIPVSVTSRNQFNKLITIKNGTVTKHSPKNGQLKKTCTMMTNSLGMIEHNYYSFANNPGENICIKGNGSQYPYVDMYEGLMLLAESRTYLDGELLGKDSYVYDSPVVHRQGLGFIGFKNIKKTDLRGHVLDQTFDPYRRGVFVSEKTPMSESSFEYNLVYTAGRLLNINMKSVTVKDILKGTVSTTANTFDGYGNILTSKTTYNDGNSVTKTYTYDNSSTLVPSDGYHIGYHVDEKETISYNGDTHVSRVAVPSHTRGSPLKRVTYSNGVVVKTEEFQYDSRGLTVKASEKAYASPNIRTSSYAYDSLGRVVSKTDPLGHTNRYAYNKSGLLERETDFQNQYIQYSYDEFGREKMRYIPETGPTYTAYSWSKTGEPGLYCKSVSPTNRNVSYHYYDALNREVCVAGTRFDGTLSYTATNYDRYGRVKSESLPYLKGKSPDKWTEYTYDDYDRVIKVTSPSGAYVSRSYNKLSETVEENQIATTTVYDAMGRTLSVTDPSGKVTYSLRADGQPDKITAPGGAETLFEYDTAGRLTLRHDPSEGNTSFTYDSGGNTSSVTDARGKTISYEYDIHDRPTVTRMPEMTVTDTYDPSTGYLTRSESSKGHSLSMTYDSHGRVTKSVEAYGDVSLEKSHTYLHGDLYKTVYKSHRGFTETETFTHNFGHLISVAISDGTKIFERKAVNSLGQTTRALHGPVTTDSGYDEYGSPTGRSDRNSKAESLAAMLWDFDPYTGNLLSRTDNVRHLTEQFEYDGLNRLTGYGAHTVDYGPNGNILAKSDAGTFSYTSAEKPYALTKARFSDPLIPTRQQTVTYASFRRPLTLKEGSATATFTYGVGLDRLTMRLRADGTTTTRYYLGGCYEYDYAPYLAVGIDANSSVLPPAEKDTTAVIDPTPAEIAALRIERLYLGGDAYTAPAVLVKTGSKADDVKLYLIVRDYLGSVTAIVDKDGKKVQELSYDAWGRLRDPDTHVNYAVGEEPELLLGRGCCGREPLPQFGLINMNARLYDPVLGRFLSPDPYVQDPAMPQNFNRYSYCLNNPLCYVDKDGEFVFLPVLVGALVGGMVNLTVKGLSGELNSIGDYFAAFGIGAVAGGAAVFTGGAVMGLASGAFAGGGFLSGMLAGATIGATETLLLSAGNSIGFGDKFVSVKDFAISVATSAVICGGISGITAVHQGQNFFKGSYVSIPKTPAPEPGQLSEDLSVQNLPKNSTPLSDPVSENPNIIEVANKLQPEIRPVASEANLKNTYSVYVGRDSEGNIRYIGITNRPVEVRGAEHLRSKTPRATLDFKALEQENIISEFGVINGKMGRNSAAIIEQTLMNRYGLLQQYNQINSIAPKYWPKLGITPQGSTNSRLLNSINKNIPRR